MSLLHHKSLTEKTKERAKKSPPRDGASHQRKRLQRGPNLIESLENNSCPRVLSKSMQQPVNNYSELTV